MWKHAVLTHPIYRRCIITQIRSRMFSSRLLLQKALQLTLFTRANCGLCQTAKSAVSGISGKVKPFSYSEVDIMDTGNERWKDVYEFDVPVVGKLT